MLGESWRIHDSARHGGSVLPGSRQTCGGHTGKHTCTLGCPSPSPSVRTQLHTCTLWVCLQLLLFHGCTRSLCGIVCKFHALSCIVLRGKTVQARTQSNWSHRLQSLQSCTHLGCLTLGKCIPWALRQGYLPISQFEPGMF